MASDRDERIAWQAISVDRRCMGRPEAGGDCPGGGCQCMADARAQLKEPPNG